MIKKTLIYTLSIVSLATLIYKVETKEDGVNTKKEEFSENVQENKRMIAMTELGESNVNLAFTGNESNNESTVTVEEKEAPAVEKVEKKEVVKEEKVKEPTVIEFDDKKFEVTKSYEAVASYYGPKFHGKMTANGESFDQNDYTAAHKTLPFNTLVKVTNLKNGKSLVVRINDRGPYIPGREIDLSKASFKKIASLARGHMKVKLEILKEN